MLPRVVWAEKSKNGLRFEIGPSYDVVLTRSQLVTHGQSSCRLQISVRGIWNERYKFRAGSAQKKEIKNNFVFCPFWAYFIPLYLFWASSYLSRVGDNGTYAISM